MGFLVLGIAILGGCEKPAERLNAPPQGQSDHPSTLQDNYVRMGDNALLAERSMSPAHFVPGSTELNALGVRRLNRYATLLKVYGGKLHYDGVSDDQELAKKRTDRIRDYLVAAGVGPDNFAVDVACADDTGTRATEASESRKGLTATVSNMQTAQADVLGGGETQQQPQQPK